MARIICPDCETHVHRAAAECPGCGRPLQPERTDGPARRKLRRRDVAAVVLAILFIALVSWLTITFVPDSEERARQRQVGAEKALVNLPIIRAVEERYYRVTGRYAGWLDLYAQVSADSVEREAERYSHTEVSSNGQAYISVQTFFREGVACAQVVRRGPETPSTQTLDTGSWSLVPNGPPRCRKVDFPWISLHWAGIGYLDIPEVGAADD
ncbi:MAG TPA: hypothetical protein VFS20_05830 [Longimicrobium sp.]|nr:hypothetical protein [Longimicrobium sp.]